MQAVIEWILPSRDVIMKSLFVDYHFCSVSHGFWCWRQCHRIRILLQHQGQFQDSQVALNLNVFWKSKIKEASRVRWYKYKMNFMKDLKIFELWYPQNIILILYPKIILVLCYQCTSKNPINWWCKKSVYPHQTLEVSI